MKKKLLMLLGTLAVLFVPFMITAGACAATFHETRVPECLKKIL